MGFLRDLRALSREADALRQQHPTQQRLAEGAAAMAAATELLREVASSPLPAGGEEGSATVVSVHQTGVVVGTDPVVDLELVVHAGGAPPRPLRRRELVPLVHLGRLQVGGTLRVRVGGSDPTALWIDWTAPA